MIREKSLELIIALIFILALVVGCGGSVSTPLSKTLAATATPIPPTSTPAPSATPEPSVKILFIGNSLTYSNEGIYRHIERLAELAKPPLIVEADSVTVSGLDLEKLWNNTDAPEVIGAGDFDVVVLQESLQDTDVDTFHEYARKFDAKIKETDAESVLFMAWTLHYSELTTEEIAEAHRDIAAELGVKVAPAGLAWQRTMEERPELNLFVMDGIHPNIYGTYLATNVVYATVFGQNPSDLAYLPSRPGRDCAAEEEDEATPDPVLEAYFKGRGPDCMTEEEAAFLRHVAWETVQEYQAQP
jgi:hypothetical protein